MAFILLNLHYFLPHDQVIELAVYGPHPPDEEASSAELRPPGESLEMLQEAAGCLQADGLSSTLSRQRLSRQRLSVGGEGNSGGISHKRTAFCLLTSI